MIIIYLVSFLFKKLLNNLIFYKIWYKICIAKYAKKKNVNILTFVNIANVKNFVVMIQIKKDLNIVQNIYFKNIHWVNIYQNFFKKMNDYIFLSIIILFLK